MSAGRIRTRFAGRGWAPSYRALFHRRPLAIRSRNPKMWTDLLHEVHRTAAERGARLLFRQRDPWNRLHRRYGRAVRDRRHGPHPALRRPSSLSWVVTTLRSVSLASGSTCLLGTAFPALNPDRRCRFLQPFTLLSATADTSRPVGRLSSRTTLWRRSILIGLDDPVGGCRPCRPPASVDAVHRAGGGPVACAQALERLAATATRVRA